jgi:hypothetical protein
VTNDVTSYRQSLSSCSLDPDSFTFSSVGFAGSVVTLPDLGVTLTIPEGALDRGYTEEIFLAVMTEGRDRPRLSDNQVLNDAGLWLQLSIDYKMNVCECHDLDLEKVLERKNNKDSKLF